MAEYLSLATVRPAAGAAVSRLLFYDVVDENFEHLYDLATVYVQNKSATTVSRGDVLALSITADNEAATTVTDGDSRKIGVVLDVGPIAVDAFCRCAVNGRVSVLNVTGTVARGNALQPSTTAKYAKAGNLHPFATALTANASGLGTVQALVYNLADESTDLVPQFFTAAVPATANYGVVNVGAGPWDGVTAGFFAGSASGTGLGVNLPGSVGNLFDVQNAGVSRFKVATNGRVDLASAVVAGGISTLTVTPGAHTGVTTEQVNQHFVGNTMTITGALATQRFTRFQAPVISAATGLTVTDASTVVIDGAPTASGSAAITNPYAFRVAAGVSRFDGDMLFGTTASSLSNWFYQRIMIDAATNHIISRWDPIFRITADAASNNLYGAQFQTSLDSNVFRYGTAVGTRYAINHYGNSSNGVSAGITAAQFLTDTSGGAAITNVFGLQGSIYHSGVGLITSHRGFTFEVGTTGAGNITTAYGSYVRLRATSTGIIATGISMLVDTPNLGSTGAITTAYGLQVLALRNTAGGSATAGGYAGYGLHLALPNQGGNTSGTNMNHGVYITGNGGTAGGGGTVTNYALYSDSTAQSLFSGSVNLANSVDLILGTGAGTKIGTATSQKLGFWNVTPVIQPASATQAAVATTGAVNTTPYGYTTAAQADGIVTLLNEMRTALVSIGAIKGAA